MAACDDGGDYVIVVSDAMRQLAAFLARVGANQLGDYADFLVRNQVSGSACSPLQRGRFERRRCEERGAVDRDRRVPLRAQRSPARFAGNDPCPNPPHDEGARRRRGRRRAERGRHRRTRALYPEQLERDRDAIAELSSAGSGRGGRAHVPPVLRARFGEPRELRAIPTYLTLHPRSAWRGERGEGSGSSKPSGA